MVICDSAEQARELHRQFRERMEPPAQAVAEFIASGRTIERVSFEDYKEKLSREKTFMNCQHVARQPELLREV